MSDVAEDKSLKDVNARRVDNRRRTQRKFVEKRAWTKEEDELLKQLVEDSMRQPGRSSKSPGWSSISIEFRRLTQLERTGKQCRERYANHLQPGVKKGGWTKEEDDMILKLQAKLGNQWAKMMEWLPGRSDNSIKNRFWSFHRSKSRAAPSKPRGGSGKKAGADLRVDTDSPFELVDDRFEKAEPTRRKSSTNRGRNTVSPQRYGSYDFVNPDSLSHEVFEDVSPKQRRTPIPSYKPKKRRLLTMEELENSTSPVIGVGGWQSNMASSTSSASLSSTEWPPKKQPTLVNKVSLLSSEEDSDSDDDEILEPNPNAYDAARGVGSSRMWSGQLGAPYFMPHQVIMSGMTTPMTNPYASGNGNGNGNFIRSASSTPPSVMNLTTVPEMYVPVSIGFVSNEQINAGKVVFKWPEELRKEREEAAAAAAAANGN
mmetsp:Transcript_7532/g.15167  ORF Transcript_7532/g.15167 Transcript_7532/m.15167 type:complete len:429 (+) Transcript_7532:213-1499(+)|eukprot:CAMPEP_0118653482 /NCGR_PEP_ID=MMETSP0785-20121206/11852_1 /TAXON_ID=91992 /ORGANISM="Bolidomonas pacifica, Strain CCMP 1866" /LENGTH=428 /DNA_ID=CAMNT_0006546023 /DNA_START=175 /DNA_END=1461 /DNA_ORIENTATION=-